MVAEYIAVSICANAGTIYHLIVVPTLWQGMTGDDWLNNGSTRDRFCRYLEAELGREVDERCERISKKTKLHALNYRKKIAFGEPSKVLIDYSKTAQFDLIVIGSPRPKGIKGLRSRMLTNNLIRALNAPLLIAPYPQQAQNE